MLHLGQVAIRKRRADCAPPLIADVRHHPVLLRILVMAGAVSVLAACGPTVSEPLAADLAKDAKSLLEGGCHGPPRSLEPEHWPARIAALQPETVTISSAGLDITTRSFFVSAWGVFIPCDPQSFAPVSGGDPVFSEVAHDVYTYYAAG